MRNFIRIFLFPSLAVICLVVGVSNGKWISGLILAAFFLLLEAFLLSGRKQRIRYWFQGYKRYLIANKGEARIAIQLLKKEFCLGKYADKPVCENDYKEIESLVEDIIKREFRLIQLFDLRANPHKELVRYQKEITRIQKQIRKIKKEVLN